MRAVYSVSPWVFWRGVYMLTAILSPMRFVRSSRIKVLLGVVIGLRMDLVKRRKVHRLGGVAWLLTSLFFFLLVVNFTGLIPWRFSFSSHLVFSLSLAIPFWLATVRATGRGAIWRKTARLVGTGLPGALASFVGLIETVSVMIRPITLALRLAVNIMAGHILIGLVRAFFIAPLMPLSLVVLGLFIGLYLLEMAVAVIQAYVFVLLLRLYLREWAVK